MARKGCKVARKGERQTMYGKSEHNLDNKGRLCIPARLLPELGERFYITINASADADGEMRPHLTMFPAEAWRRLQDRLAETQEDDEASANAAMVFAYASECTLDSSGRVSLTSEQRDYAGLTKAVTVNGNNRTADIWDTESWKAHQETILNPKKVRRTLARAL